MLTRVASDSSKALVVNSSAAGMWPRPKFTTRKPIRTTVWTPIIMATQRAVQPTVAHGPHGLAGAFGAATGGVRESSTAAGPVASTGPGIPSSRRVGSPSIPSNLPAGADFEPGGGPVRARVAAPPPARPSHAITTPRAEALPLANRAGSGRLARHLLMPRFRENRSHPGVV